ncbi:MAG TPA: DUF397 domain-containing protein [Streptosporangiaceae bacterium]|nr:DUF397 domain-containing protein [Streptosporangiaceae bacterium]
MDTHDMDLSRAVWRTSSRSNNGGNCVETATNLPGVVVVRDSKNPGPMLRLTPQQWRHLVARVKGHHF